MTTDAPVPENPLIDLPLVGWPVALLDKLFIDLGHSAWWAQTMEFMILMIVLFAVATMVLGRIVPWLSAELRAQARWLVAPVPAVLLAPEWLVTKLIVRFGKTPGRIVHGYGDSVLLLASGLETGLIMMARLLGGVGRCGRPIACLLIVFGFLVWNSASCLPDSVTCVSPVQQWGRLLATPRGG